MSPLQISMWNANGVSRHKNELAQFLFEKNIDVMLLSETHLTDKHNFHIPGYLFYATNHPDGKAHGGTGILIRSRIKHHLYNRTEMDYLQSTSISIKSSSGRSLLPTSFCSFWGPILWIFQLTRWAIHSGRWLQCQAYALGITSFDPKGQTTLQRAH